MSKPINFVYDALNRMTAKNFVVAGTPDNTYEYDLGSRLISANNSVASNSFMYDALDRLLTNVQLIRV